MKNNILRTRRPMVAVKERKENDKVTIELKNGKTIKVSKEEAVNVRKWLRWQIF